MPSTDRVAASRWLAAVVLAVVQGALVLTGSLSPLLGFVIGAVFLTAAATAFARNRR